MCHSAHAPSKPDRHCGEKVSYHQLGVRDFARTDNITYERVENRHELSATKGGTPPSQLCCVEHTTQHVETQLAVTRATAATHQMGPQSSAAATTGEYVDWL